MGMMKNYSKMYDAATADHVDERALNPIDPVVDEPETVAEEPKAPTTMTGVVVDCNSLNVREEPHRKATVLTILMADAEVQVDADEQLDEWYHVYTATGLDGFCMKKYVTIKE